MILGMSFSHNATACVVDPADGGVVFCCSEERYTRRKNEWGIPGQVLNHIFQNVLPPGQITAVAIGESCRMGYGCEEFAALINLADYATRDAYMRAKARFLPLLAKEGLTRALGPRVQLRELIRARLVKMGVRAPVTFTDHHTAHAASAYFSSPFETALVLTLDGEGDRLSGTCWRGSGAQLTCMDTLSERASIGLFYKSITALLGFKVNQQEGQVLGLAAYGNPNRFHETLSQVLHAEDSEGRLNVISRAAEHHMDLFSRRNVRFSRLLAALPLAFTAKDWRGLLNAILAREYRRFYRDIIGEALEAIDPPTAADIAAGAQRVFEETALAVLRFFQKKIPARNVALAGGIFANVQLNQRILELPGVDSIHVHPGMGDEGLALGAALAHVHRGRTTKAAKSVLDHVFLGPSPSDADTERALACSGASWESCCEEKLVARTAAALAEGHIVGLVRGRLEYGPRALGHRSILADPRNDRVCSVLNDGLKRSPMMPFAPAILDVCFEEVFDTNKTPGALSAARFMTITLNVRPEWRERIPAVVHIDGTARPQVLTEEENPFLYAVVSDFRQLTGVGCVLNTSYNRHDEPIVNTPDQALSILETGTIEYLVLGACWVTAPQMTTVQGAPLPRSAS